MVREVEGEGKEKMNVEEIEAWLMLHPKTIWLVVVAIIVLFWTLGWIIPTEPSEGGWM